VKVLADVAYSLGGTNTRQSIDGLKGLMARYNKVAPSYLSAMARGSTPPAYSQHVVGAIAHALADAGVSEHVPVLLIAATLKFSDVRLSEQTAAIAAALPRLATETNREKIASTLVSILEDPDYSEPDVHFHAAIAAGKLGVKKATPPLRRVLLESRRYRDQMRAARWALKQIHGKAPDMPDPVQKQGNWIVRTEGL
jgi:HEAT repeat protein